LKKMSDLRHHKLVVWQRADDLFIELHQISLQHLPPVERYELGSQVRRAAYGVASNIVEGIARRSELERLRYFNMAEGPLAEVSYCIHVAHRLGCLDAGLRATLETALKRVAAPLAGLIRSIRTREAGE
jgi:four helix bundle protein